MFGSRLKRRVYPLVKNAEPPMSVPVASAICNSALVSAETGRLRPIMEPMERVIKATVRIALMMSRWPRSFSSRFLSSSFALGSMASLTP